ncbi:hypothetical protein [Lentzea cavernae]|nr:hypothetical protein [Lentzea cavernae]
MSNDDVEGVVAAVEYEPPILFDLGSVVGITFGSSSGAGDASGQSFS